MKESTHNLTLIARGACLGYVICFCLGLAIFRLLGVPIILIGIVRDVETLLIISSFFAFYGMGLGITTELCLAHKPFREKLLIYFVAILFSPALFFVPIFHLICLFGQFNSYAFFTLLALTSLGSIIACLCYKKLSLEDIFTYLVGYISVFVALVSSFSLFIALNPQGIYIFISFAILSFTFSTTSVSLTKLFFSRIKKLKL